MQMYIRQILKLLLSQISKKVSVFKNHEKKFLKVFRFKNPIKNTENKFPCTDLAQFYMNISMVTFVFMEHQQSYTTPGLGYFDTTLVLINTKLVYFDTRLVLKVPSLVRMYQNNQPHQALFAIFH